MRVAAIDCGTNTIRLLVADVTVTPRGATLVDVHREMRVVRLGAAVAPLSGGTAIGTPWR